LVDSTAVQKLMILAAAALVAAASAGHAAASPSPASTVLVPGEPDTVAAKLPQAVNINAFPTSFFVGRDGRVRGTHAGFPSPGSGEYYTKAERDVTARIEKLLAERVPTSW